MKKERKEREVTLPAKLQVVRRTQLCEMMGWHPTTARRHELRGNLHPLRIGRDVYYRLADIEEFLRQAECSFSPHLPPSSNSCP
jgi:hypothetical protein